MCSKIEIIASLEATNLLDARERKYWVHPANKNRSFSIFAHNVRIKFGRSGGQSDIRMQKIFIVSHLFIETILFPGTYVNFLKILHYTLFLSLIETSSTHYYRNTYYIYGISRAFLLRHTAVASRQMQYDILPCSKIVKCEPMYLTVDVSLSTHL